MRPLILLSIVALSGCAAQSAAYVAPTSIAGVQTDVATLQAQLGQAVGLYQVLKGVAKVAEVGDPKIATVVDPIFAKIDPIVAQAQTYIAQGVTDANLLLTAATTLRTAAASLAVPAAPVVTVVANPSAT